MSSPTVFLVDDDHAVRDSFALLMRSVGLPFRSFATAQEFLDAYDAAAPGCLVLNIRLPGMSGLELRDRLLQRGPCPPVIFITGYADVPMAVRAIKGGAADFLEKPFNDQVLLDAIHSALERDAESREKRLRHAETANRLLLLTAREREVMTLMVAGRPNKAIATQLGISRKTLGIHRGRIMKKMQARSLSELLRMAILAGLHSS
jgi:two-component system response regulator FixJ